MVEASASFLASREAMAFRWFVSFDEVIDGREKITYLRSGENLLVRGVGFTSHTERGHTLRDYYFDGATVTITSPNEDFYASASFSGSFDELVAAIEARTAARIPIWVMMSEGLAERLVSGIEHAAYLGETLIAGQPAHHLAFTTDDEDWQIWIARDEAEPLPLMIVGTDTRVQGWPQYRAYFLDWNLEPDRDPAQFVFVPEEDDRPVAMPALTGPLAADGRPE